MDSYHFRFEKMSNLDLHPLSLPVSRLSPAKSSSSIDQFTHHHSKGDSAYSSFSGGSTVPDYPSSFLLEELQSQALHYADLKCIHAKSSPALLDSESKSMGQLYRSMEPVAPQPHCGFSNSEAPPPTPPARLNSFVTTRNLENSRARQSPEGQIADSSTIHAPFKLKKTIKKDSEDKKLNPTGILNKSPLQACQPEHLQTSRSGDSENQMRKRSYSAYGRPVSDNQCFVSSRNVPQNMISGSIQHKGPFYFVTGVFKCTEPSVLEGIGEGASVDTSSEWSYKAQRRRQSCPDGPSGKLFFQEENKFSIQSSEVLEHANRKQVNSSFSSQQPEGVEDMSRESGRHHSTSHPIFYCGPEDSSVGAVMTPALLMEEATGHPKKEEPMLRASRRPQLDLPNDKISKEATPLLYHLTGANSAPYKDQFKNKDYGNEIKSQDRVKDKAETARDGQTSPSSEYQQSETSKEQPSDSFYPCGTLDDSYQKYYKKKLKDAQSKVLRETSFKRRDLQLSLSHRTKISVNPDRCPSQEMLTNFTSPTPHLHGLQEAYSECTKELGQDIEKMMIQKESEQPQNIAQPQVPPRVGSRKRLTADQKKLSNSEPEKLHQLAGGPAHMTCRSLGDEAEGLLSEGDHGLVAARRRMFETRGRALSASNFSKSSLKHLQHNALVAYMERKTGQKVAEPQRPAPEVPSQRHSTVEKMSEWSSRRGSGSKKLHRPLSAGQILDSVSSSIKYSQFITARQSSWREESSSKEKSASVESLLDQPEKPEFLRTRRTSTPHAFQVQKRPEEFSAFHNKASPSGQRKVEESAILVHHNHTPSIHDEPRVRVRAPRGKSMEELGASIIMRPEVLSKSSEQLDQLQTKQSMLGNERRAVSFLAEGGKRAQKKLLDTGEHAGNTQAGLESPLLTKHVPSNDDEVHIASYIGRKHNDDTAQPMPSHPTDPGGVKLEYSKELLDISSHDEHEATVSSQEVSLSHGVTTDPSLWSSSPEMNEMEGNECPSPETEPSSEPQSEQPRPSAEKEPIAALPSVQEVGSNLVPALNGEQDGNVKEKDYSLVPKMDKSEWEVLVQEVVSADQSLARTLYPITDRKTALMLMEQLLSEDNLLMEEHYKKKQEQNNPETASHSLEMTNEDTSPMTRPPSVLPNARGADIIGKKRRLAALTEERLKGLEEERGAVQWEEQASVRRAEHLQALVKYRCSPLELQRYTQFMEDLERVLNLLLCLSARLARVQNALSTVDDSTDTDDRRSLDERHSLLCRQRDDAKDLKNNLDRRERVVSTFLSNQLTEAELQEYRRFLQTKASLLIRQKDLDEKQRLWEEQLEALLSSIPPTDRVKTWAERQ